MEIITSHVYRTISRLIKEYVRSFIVVFKPGRNNEKAIINSALEGGGENSQIK